MVAPVVDILCGERQDITRASDDTKIATLASLAVYIQRTNNFRHILFYKSCVTLALMNVMAVTLRFYVIQHKNNQNSPKGVLNNAFLTYCTTYKSVSRYVNIR